jgi:hypothetical protein
VAAGAEPTAAAPDTGTLVDVERRHIVRVLSGVRWRIEGAGGGAQILGLKPSTLRSRMASSASSVRAAADARHSVGARSSRVTRDRTSSMTMTGSSRAGCGCP